MNYILVLKELKMSEILCAITFDVICISNFDTKFVHCTMEGKKHTMVAFFGHHNFKFSRLIKSSYIQFKCT
jgi:hypothetical protein